MCTTLCFLAAECKTCRLFTSHSAFKTAVQMLGNALCMPECMVIQADMSVEVMQKLFPSGYTDCLDLRFCMHANRREI